MNVRVRLLGDYRKYLRGRDEPLTCELPEAASVADVVSALEIDPTSEIVVGVNGQLGRLDSALAEGDEVMLVSPMSGGEVGRVPDAGRDASDSAVSEWTGRQQGG